MYNRSFYLSFSLISSPSVFSQKVQWFPAFHLSDISMFSFLFFFFYFFWCSLFSMLFYTYNYYPIIHSFVCLPCYPVNTHWVDSSSPLVGDDVAKLLLGLGARLLLVLFTGHSWRFVCLRSDHFGQLRGRELQVEHLISHRSLWDLRDGHEERAVSSAEWCPTRWLKCSPKP